jgi:hypothetical protein
MIRPNELRIQEFRIGNWFVNSEGEHEQIKEFFFDSVMGQADPPLIYLNHDQIETCGAIPITPEILERCGFESNPYQDRYELGYFHFEHCAIRQMIWIEKYPHVNYLHQLQNLYFALTGEELQYNP